MRLKKAIVGVLLTVLVLENSLTSLAAPVSDVEIVTEEVTQIEEETVSESAEEKATESAPEESVSFSESALEETTETVTDEAAEETESTVWETLTEETETETGTILEENLSEELTSEVSLEDVSENKTMSETEAELDYILGRPMTEDEIVQQEALVPEELPQLEVMPMKGATDIQAGLNASPIALYTTQSLPEKYDSRDEDIITPVKNQNPWGTCWSFATMALMESSWKQQYDETLDLSEHHLAYFVKNTGYDPLGNASEDTIVPYNDAFYLNAGGNLFYSAFKMMNWHGAANEADYPYPNTSTVPEAIAKENAQDIGAYAKNVFFVPTDGATQEEKVETVKQLIQTYGCVEWSYYHANSFYNASTGAFYLNTAAYGTNHSITVVGWDDTYSKSNFNSTMQPENDGAWIVKNSWGESFGKGGYIYISYEDKSLGAGNPVGVIVAGDIQDYDNNYFYGNTIATSQSAYYQGIANVYQIDGDTAKQKIKAVSFMAADDSMSYSIQLYKNPTMTDGVVTNPVTGTALLEEPVTGEIGYTGLYTVAIPEVTVDIDDYVAAVITFDSAGWIYYVASYTVSDGEKTVLTQTNVTEAGQSFCNYSTSASDWIDGADNGRSYVINLLTENVTEEISVPVLTYSLDNPEHFEDTIDCNLKWVKCNNALSYKLYRAEGTDGTYEEIASIPSSNRTYQDPISLEYKEKIFSYKLAAVYENNVIEESEPVLVDMSEAQLLPGTDFKQYMNFALLEWEEMSGAAGYILEKKTADATEYTQLADVKTGENLSFKDTEVSLYEKVYDYRIRAYTSDGIYSDWKEWSTTDSFSLSQYDGNQILLKWKKQNNSTFFRLKSEKYTWKIGNYTAARFSNSYPVGDAKKYWMEMYVSEETYNNGDLPVYVTSDIYYYAVPEALTNLKASFEKSTASFTWDASTTADTIAIYRSRNAEDMGETAYAKVEGTATAYEDTAINSIGMYYYWFVPQVTNSSGEVILGEAVAAQIEVTVEPVNLVSVTEKTETSVEIVWEKHNLAEGYSVYRKAYGDSEYTKIASIEDLDQLSYLDEGVTTGKIYEYKVVIVCEGGESGLEETKAVSARTSPSAVSIAENGVTYESVTINSSVGLEYALGKIDSDKTTLTYTKATEDTLTFDGLEPNTPYMVYVRTNAALTGENAVYGPAVAVSTLIKAQMQLSIKDVVLSKGNKLPFSYTVTPENLHYPDTLEVTAADAEGQFYEVMGTVKTGAVVINGKDGNEICRISNGYFYATGESADKDVYVTVKRGSLEAEFHVRIHVPVTDMQVNVVSVNGDTAVTSLETFKIGETAQLEAHMLPSNTEETIEWSSSNEKVVSVKAFEDNPAKAQITANGIGSCVITAISTDGVKKSMTVMVNKSTELYGIWISDRNDLSGTIVEKNPDTGEYISEKLEKQPVYELNDTTVTSMTVVSYVLEEESGGAIRKAKDEDGIVFRSSDATVASVAQDGTVIAVGSGEADIIAYESNGNGIYGSCHVTVTVEEKETTKPDTYPLDKAVKLSAVVKSLSIESFALDEKSSCEVQIKDQYGKRYSSAEEKQLFTYTSSSPSICMVDENGVVRPNPTYSGKTASVKITAALKEDKAGRKVTFTVKILTQKQIDRIELECTGCSKNASVAGDIISEVYVKGGTLTFAVKAYDSKGNAIEDPNIKFAMSDTKVAKVKDNKDGTVTVTMNKAGRVNLTATGNDVWKKAASMQIVAADTKPYLSKTSLTLNRKLASEEYRGEQWKTSEDVTVQMPDDAGIKSFTIVSASVGKTQLGEDELINIAWLENGDSSYRVAVKEAYAESLAKNNKISVTVAVEIESALLDESVTEYFTLTVKVTSQEPKVTVSEAKSINRFYMDKDETLLVLKAPSIITEAEVLDSEYFTVTELKRGQWYLKFSDETGTYNAKNAKITLRLKAEGYEPVEKKLTVQTPYKAPAISQQSVPLVHFGSENQQADIVLYDKSGKMELSGYEIVSFSAPKLAEGAVSGSSFSVSLKEGAAFRNNEKAVAQILVQKEEWAAPVALKISVKVSTKAPKIMMASSKVTLNNQAEAEKAAVALWTDQKNIMFRSREDWNLQMYDATAKEWFPVAAGFGNDWLSISYDVTAQKMIVGIRPGSTVISGNYKVRIKDVLKDFEEVYKEFTVYVADVKPTVTVSVKGKQDLINRASGSLVGTLKLKNAIASSVTNVSILVEDGSDVNPTYKAELLPNNKFSIRLTHEGMQDASLKKQKVTLPIAVTMENGTVVYGNVRFSLTQAKPNIKIPAMQTIYKSGRILTKEYDFASTLADGVSLDKIDVVFVPKGFSAVYRDGSVVVTLNDRGIKAGTYSIKVNLYFNGAAEGTKPQSKTIKVKVTE